MSNEINDILNSGSKEERISTIKSLSNTSENSIINIIVSMLSDPDIEVRGEVFSTLVLNQNKISEILIQNLSSENKNVRAFSALILANRRDSDAIPFIIKLADDESSLVRSCALGALGYLRANDASEVIHNYFSDSSLEVKKSALHAALEIGDVITLDEIKELEKETDSDLDKLLTKAKQNF